jgi:hypothetical protein
MRWIHGVDLNEKQQKLVFSAFGYRWTIENLERAKEWFGRLGCPTMKPITDKQWLTHYCFQFVNNGSRLGRANHCDPAYMHFIHYGV